MKLIVTGAAGFIGMHISQSLLKQGHEVIGFDNINPYYSTALKEDRLTTLSHYENFKFINLDIADRNQLAEVNFDGVDGILNLAAQAGVRYAVKDPYSYIQSNIVGFVNLLELAREKKFKFFIYASSSSVYGMGSGEASGEGDLLSKSLNLYAATKQSNELIADAYANIHGLNLVGLRFFSVYGPWGRPDMAYFGFASKILKGEPITLFNNGEMLRDYTYIDDVVHSLDLLIAKSYANSAKTMGVGRNIVYNIGNGSPIDLRDMVDYLERFLGKKAVRNNAPYQVGEAYQTHADMKKFHDEFDFKAGTEFSKGLSEFVQWFISVDGVKYANSSN